MYHTYSEGGFRARVLRVDSCATYTKSAPPPTITGSATRSPMLWLSTATSFVLVLGSYSSSNERRRLAAIGRMRDVSCAGICAYCDDLGTLVPSTEQI